MGTEILYHFDQAETATHGGNHSFQQDGVDSSCAKYPPLTSRIKRTIE